MTLARRGYPQADLRSTSVRLTWPARSASWGGWSCPTASTWLRQLGVDRDGLTLALRHPGTPAATLEPYEPEAETVLAVLAGIELSRTKVDSIGQVGGAVAHALMSEGNPSESRQFLPNERLDVKADGLMLWIDDDWHEVKLAALFASSELSDISKDRKQVTHQLHLHGDLNDRKAGLCYLLQTSQGLDNGSGPAESAANHVLQQRMKRAGMRCDRRSGAAMAA